MKFHVRWQVLALLAIVGLALGLRLYGLDWDQGHSFHPDERQILFRVTTLGWPTNWQQFLDPEHSPLNPHFFAYGSFPLYLLALLGSILHYELANPDYFARLILLGRVVSALFDTGTVLLTGLLTLASLRDKTYLQRYGINPWSASVLSALLVAFTPLHLQLSHFYAVDTLLVFFVLLTLLACVVLVDTEKVIRWSFLLGLAYGLALATKFSAAPLLLPILIAFVLRWYRQRGLPERMVTLADMLVTLLFVLTLASFFFVLTQPYVLLDWHNFVQQVTEQGDMARGKLDFPYVRQFANTLPYVYPLENMLVWGLGIMLGCAACVGLGWFGWRLWRRDLSLLLIPFSWIVVYGAITGSFYVKFMRYMLPIYPALILFGVVALLVLASQIRFSEPHFLARFDWLARPLHISLLGLVVAGTLFQGLALLNVYSEPNTRIQASRWIYQHVTPGSVLTYEQWDDALPVALDGNDPALYAQAISTDGQGTTGLDLYGDDTQQKAETLAQMLAKVNVITMPTERLYKSIPRLPARYPLTIRYYQLLFNGELGFELAAQFEVRPHLLGITLDDSSADESYSVFDHPHARVFVRKTVYTPQQIKQKLLAGLNLP